MIEVGTLVSVALGGVISQGTAWAIERRREGREERVEERAIRQATRMVRNELTRILGDLDASAEGETWWNRADLLFETPAWGRFADTVAGSDIDDESWAALTDAYNEIASVNETLRRHIIAAKNRGTFGLHFGGDAPELVAKMREAIQKGVASLEAFMA